ncbi:MAG: AI-2E family transporter [Sphingomonadaceae bacterium]
MAKGEFVPESKREIARSTLVVLLLAGIAILVALLARTLLLIFAAILIAVLIRAAGAPLRRAGLPNTPSVILGFIGILVLLGLFGWLFGAQLGSQLGEIYARIPRGVELVREWLDTTPFGGQLAEATPPLSELAGQALSVAFGVFGVVANTILVLIGAVYLALHPSIYARGLARLFPKRQSERIERALNASGRSLRNYLLGQLLTMTIVGTLVAVGLGIVGVPSALALGVIIALANFIPLIGPFIGAVPGILIALTAGPETALYATGVYFVAQQLEGNVLTPLVQEWAVSIPPALLIFMLAAFGTLFGVVGVILAAPMAVVLYTMITMLWTRDTLGHDVTVPGGEA